MTRLAGALLVAMLISAATTVSPTQHNFGRTAVNAPTASQVFRVSLPSGASLTDSIDLSLVGPDAQDFDIGLTGFGRGGGRTDCVTGRPFPPFTPGVCDIPVRFWPRSIGPKTARLQIKDKAGTTTSASLSGIGIAPLCEMKVVFCNYAHLYSGSFSWRSNLSGPYGSNVKNITVTIVNGVATCSGTEVDTQISRVGTQTHTTADTGSIQGVGLAALEFEKDSTGADVYRVSAACPSPNWRPSVGRPVQPAEMGTDYAEESYPQTMPNPNTTLRGGSSMAHPDTDPTNGVSGTRTVTWMLQRS